MSPKRWILLLIFYISYLMFGAAVYYHIEHSLEKAQRADELAERIKINEYLLEELSDKNATTQNVILEKISDYCGKPVTDYSQDEYEIPYTWTFYHAFFFAFTVCSTVGYGNISPTTTLGRMIMIVYSVIGIPVNGILFAGLGEYFGRTFEAIYRRYKKYKASDDIHNVPPQLGLITTVVIALIPGVALFLLLPAWVFSYFEGWPYSIAFYYSYVTTTTIGFGDFVPTFGADQPREFRGWFVVYQIFVIVWFIFSLGYLVMIMTFITRGLQSKKLEYLKQQLSSNLKNRIWTGVTKDVGYLRRMLNELYIQKVKPVYADPGSAYMLPRSASCPELSMYRVEPAPMPSRRRALSMCADVIAAQAMGADMPIMHASSDTEISKYDREKTFETAKAYREKTDLLAQVVTALATVKPPPTEVEEPAALYGGYHGFSDSQILASEWSFSTNNEFSAPPRQPRARACSDFNVETPRWRSQRPLRAPHNEWTWSGDNEQIQEAFNKRYKSQPNGVDNFIVHLEDGNQSEEQLKKANAAAATRAKKFSMPDGLRKLFPFHRKRPSQDVERKLSIVSVPEGATALPARPPLDYFSSTMTMAGTPSYYQSQNGVANSTNSLASGGLTNYGFQLDDAGELNTSTHTGAYQRKPADAGKRRRESIYMQNPALAARRGSMFPPSSAAALSAQMQRRGSLAITHSSNAAAAARRGSLFPSTAAPRRGSIFSVGSEKDMDVLEQTTIADLIRALEVVHTQAVLDEQQQTLNSIAGGKKKRKMGNAGLDPPQLPSILSLFDPARSQPQLPNRLYTRRSTIVGTLPANATARRASGAQILDPPPSYTEKPLTPVTAVAASSTAAGPSKFRRRFSVRPTALQIPPGKAPPPGVNLSEESIVSAPSTPSQTALQRRLSLRPSPLAREPSTPIVTTGALDEAGTALTSAQALPEAPKASTRLLPLPQGTTAAVTRPSTSSTHSPLSRIVQITQAQRKSSMPDGLGQPRKPAGTGGAGGAANTGAGNAGDK